MKKFILLVAAFWVILTLAACSNGSPSSIPTVLSSGNLNLIFVTSQDLAYHASGDVDANTANYTDQGPQRSLRMATFLKEQVLGKQNVSGIYALEPMTHLQTTHNFPDMAALVTIEQFSLLNQITLSDSKAGGNPFTGNSYPINVSYAAQSVSGGVATSLAPSTGIQGLDFKDQGGVNETLLISIIQANVPGFYVFSAPWETVSGLLVNINRLQGYNLAVPASYQGPNYIYSISVTPSGKANLTIYNSNLNPPSTYPRLPPQALVTSKAAGQAHFSITITGGAGGAVIPAGINTNETIYMIRHAEAHPQGSWDDGNYVAAGQWRALALPEALRGKISPNRVYSVDPAQVKSGTASTSGRSSWSYVRPSLTVEPYAIANMLPFYLAADFEIFANNPPQEANPATTFFFNGGQLSNQKVLLAWEHSLIPVTVNALISNYFPNGGGPTAPGWPSDDYDGIWTVTLDANGNLKVDNSLYEGIQSTALPTACPQF